MHADPKAYLDALTGHPEGSTQTWRARYAPLIAEVTAPRKTPLEPDLQVSLIVVAWRATDGVQRALEHIGAQDHIARSRMQVILVDNSGDAGLGALRQAIHDHVDVHVRMHVNTGASPARNTGACHADAPVLAFIDDDGLIASDYVATGLAHFAKEPDLLGLRGRIIALTHPYFTTLAGHYDRGTQPLEDCLITEGCMMVRRESFMQVGGFGDKLFGHEGIELTYRLKRAYPEGRVCYVPDVVMKHDYFDSWQKFFDKNTRYLTIDAATHTRTVDLQAFMDAYFATRFPRSPMPPDQRAAWLGLKLLKALLRYGVVARSS